MTGVQTCALPIFTIQNISSSTNLIPSIFEKVAVNRINIDMISQTAPVEGKVNLSFTIPKIDLQECLEIISEFTSKDNISIHEGITKFSIVGIGMKTTSGVAARLFKLFSENNIEVNMITTSEIKITCAIKESDKVKAVNIAAKEFNL